MNELTDYEEYLQFFACKKNYLEVDYIDVWEFGVLVIDCTNIDPLVRTTGLTPAVPM